MNAGTPVRFKRDEYERGWEWGIGHVVIVSGYRDEDCYETETVAIYYPDGRIATGESWMLDDLSDSDGSECCEVNLELKFSDGRRVLLTEADLRRGIDKTEKEELEEMDRDAKEDPAP